MSAYTYKFPPRIISNNRIAGAPDSFNPPPTTYLSLEEHTSILSEAQAKISELEGKLETITEAIKILPEKLEVAFQKLRALGENIDRAQEFRDLGIFVTNALKSIKAKEGGV